MHATPSLAGCLNTAHEIFAALDAGGPDRSAALARAGSLNETLRSLSVDLAAPQPALAQALSLLAVRLGALASLGSTAVPAAQIKDLAEDYERVLSELTKVPAMRHVKAPSLRPQNHVRSAVHVMNAVLGVVAYQYFLSYNLAVGVMLTVFASYVAMDVARRLFPNAEAGLYDGIFGAVTRPRERYIIPAATWYCLGMLLATAFAEKRVAQVSVLVLGFGDPIASFCGKRWPLARFPNKKSVGGCLAFVAGSGLVAFLWLTVALTEPKLPSFSRAIVAATAGALAELLGGDRVDDNLLIPLAAWAAQAWLLD